MSRKPFIRFAGRDFTAINELPVASTRLPVFGAKESWQLSPRTCHFRNRNSCFFISTRAPRKVTPSMRKRNLCSAAFSPHSLIAPPEPTTRCQGNPGTSRKMRTTWRAAPAQPAARAMAP